MDKTTSVRKARGQAKGSQKISFSSRAGAAKAKETGEEVQREEFLQLTATLSYISTLTCFSTSLKLTEPQRHKGLWEERLHRVHRGRRVGRLRLPHRPVSLSVRITYDSGFIYGLGWFRLTAPISFAKMS